MLTEFHVEYEFLRSVFKGVVCNITTEKPIYISVNRDTVLEIYTIYKKETY